MFGQITDILFIAVFALLLLFVLFKFNKWLLVKNGILRILFVVLKDPDVKKQKN